MMDKELLRLVKYASDSRKYQHLFLRGNFQQDMFYDKVDLINAWNRLWLSAYATGVQILAAVIMNNHLHITAAITIEGKRTQFKHHFRLSITQYHNRRYKVNGTLGTRRFNHGIIKGMEDLTDCICYHIRNVVHHKISKDYLNYPYSTARHIFDLKTHKQEGYYTNSNLPDKIARAYLPLREKLPDGWMLTKEGMIVPPKGIFRRDIVEAIFGTKENYLNAISKMTTREADDKEEPDFGKNASDSRIFQDERVVEYIDNQFGLAIPSMETSQKIEAIKSVLMEYPRVSKSLLSRVFGMPYNKLWRKLRE